MSALFLQMEINFTLFLQSLGSWLATPMQLFSFLGSEYFYLLVFPAIYWCLDSAIGLRTGIVLALSVSTNSILKIFLHTPRPYWIDSRVRAFSSETSFGLPSGHAQNAVSVWGSLANGFKKRWLTIVSVLVIFMVGLSRIYLGVHFLHDVLAGWLAGVVLLALVRWGEKPFSRWIAGKSFSFQLAFVFGVSAVIVLLGHLAVSVSSGFIVPESWVMQALTGGDSAPTPYSLEGIYTIAGVFFGFSAGFAWLRNKYGGYKVEGSLEKRVLRFCIGLASLAVIYLVLKLIAPVQPQWLADGVRFLRYAIIGLWIAAGAPVLFKKLKLDI